MSENFLMDMLESSAELSPEIGICSCGHEGRVENVLCYICNLYMREEMARNGRVEILSSDTKELLLALGLGRTSVWRALKRGWITLDYHHDEANSQDPGPGGFAQLKNPYAFAQSQVRHIFAIWGIPESSNLWEKIDDFVQEGLLKCWELRHREGVRSFPAFFSTVIRRKVQDHLPREMKYELWGGEYFEGEVPQQVVGRLQG